MINQGKRDVRHVRLRSSYPETWYPAYVTSMERYSGGCGVPGIGGSLGRYPLQDLPSPTRYLRTISDS